MICHPHSGLPALCPKSRTWRRRDGLAGAPVLRRLGPSLRTSLPPCEGMEPVAAARLVRGAPPGTGCRHWTQGKQAARGGGACRRRTGHRREQNRAAFLAAEDRGLLWERSRWHHGAEWPHTTLLASSGPWRLSDMALPRRLCFPTCRCGAGAEGQGLQQTSSALTRSPSHSLAAVISGRPTVPAAAGSPAGSHLPRRGEAPLI